MKQTTLKQLPTFATDEEAEHFVDTADLSEYDLSGFVPLDLGFGEPTGELCIRLPEQLLAAVKAKAKERGIPYTRLIRDALERAVAG